jgi:translation initiation factor IF-3
MPTCAVRIRPDLRTDERAAALQRIRHRLGQGDSVLLSVYFRGREAQQPEIGTRTLRALLTELQTETEVIERSRSEVLLRPLPRS